MRMYYTFSGDIDRRQTGYECIGQNCAIPITQSSGSIHVSILTSHTSYRGFHLLAFFLQQFHPYVTLLTTHLQQPIGTLVTNRACVAILSDDSSGLVS
jgi:hypothetical protein